MTSLKERVSIMTLHRINQNGKYILIMYDGSYHKWVAPYDRRYVSIDEVDWVQEYNRRSVYNFNRCVFSKDGDWSVVEKISKENPQVLDIPKTRLSWGGRIFS